MPYQNNYTAKEKKAYFNKRAKSGAKVRDGKPLSDFVRGINKAKADMIHKAQVRCATRHNQQEALKKDSTGDWLNK